MKTFDDIPIAKDTHTLDEWLQFGYDKPDLPPEEEAREGEIERKIDIAYKKAGNTRKVLEALFLYLINLKHIEPNPNPEDGATMVIFANTLNIHDFFDVIESTFLDAYLPDGDY
jgi:hypothetical protein